MASIVLKTLPALLLWAFILAIAAADVLPLTSACSARLIDEGQELPSEKRRRSTSLVQMQAVKVRIEAEDASATTEPPPAVPSSSSGTSNGTAPIMVPPSTNSTELHPADVEMLSQSLETPKPMADSLPNHEQDVRPPVRVAGTVAGAAAAQNATGGPMLENATSGIVPKITLPEPLVPAIKNETELHHIVENVPAVGNETDLHITVGNLPVVGNETELHHIVENTTEEHDKKAPEAIDINSREPANAVPTGPPSSRELIDEKARSETLPSEEASGNSIMDNLNGIADMFWSGKPGGPQILSILMMMLLPAGICTVMYGILIIMRRLEDDNAQPADVSAVGFPDQRLTTLGEVVHPNAPKRPYEPLCPELLAPADNESLIALPSLREADPGPKGIESSIVSKTGAPIVRILMTRMADGVPDVAGGGSYSAPGKIQERISLVAFKKQNALGFCELQMPQRGSVQQTKWKCNIYRPTGEHFATLEEESVGVVSSLLSTSSNSMAGASTIGQKCYMLTSVASGTRFWIQGDVAQRSLLVVSENDWQKPIIHVDSGKQLQFNAEEQGYYRLRVQPKTDAGVVIMALLAIDRLPSS